MLFRPDNLISELQFGRLIMCLAINIDIIFRFFYIINILCKYDQLYEYIPNDANS